MKLKATFWAPIFCSNFALSLTLKTIFCWEVVVAQLVERLLPTQEVRGSNPVIGKNLFIYLFSVNCVLKRRKKEKRGREWPIFLKKESFISHVSLYVNICPRQITSSQTHLYTRACQVFCMTRVRHFYSAEWSHWTRFFKKGQSPTPFSFIFSLLYQTIFFSAN